jgi:outer membrane receptor protein involved in Fe transport
MKITTSLLLLAAALPVAAFAQTTTDSSAAATAVPAAPVTMAALTVTGSNLRNGPAEGAENVRSLGATEIDESGIFNLDTLVKKFPEINSGSFNGNQSNTSSPGTAGISLRGLGVQSTLVLINGRRVTAAPFAQGGSAASLGTQSFVDINMIPEGAVARVEVLKDGASAIYGADAIGGVVNFILKDNVQGSTFDAMYGNFAGASGLHSGTEKFDVYSGATEGKLSVFALADYYHQGAINYEQLPMKLGLNLTGNNPGTFILPVGAINPLTGTAVTAATTTAGKSLTPSNTTTGYPPTFTNTVSASNTFDSNRALDPQPQATRMGALVTLDYALAPSLTAFDELNYQHNDSYETLSPSPISTLNTVVLPANAVYNPLGVALTTSPTAGGNIVYRFVEEGNRLTKTTSTFTREVAGLKGTFGPDWTWELSGLYNQETSHNDLSNGFVSQAAVNAALASPSAATALNLFTNANTHNSAAVLAGLLSHGVRDGLTDITSGTAKATGTVFTLPAGNIDLALGVDDTHEYFRDHRTQDQLLNQSTPVPLATGGRTTEAGYAEVGVPLTSPTLKIPLLYSLTLDVAGRAEHFSDRGFHNASVPKLGLRYQPFDDEITFRGSWGKGYRAPSLDELYQPQTTSVVFNIVDPARFPTTQNSAVDGTTAQRTVITGGNPALTPEKSKNYDLGTTFEPHGIKGLSLSADYFHIEVTNRIGSPASPAVMLANPGIFGQYLVRAPRTASDIAAGLPGQLLSVYQVLGNYGTAITEGFDFSGEYRLATQAAGTFTLRADFSNTFSLRTQSTSSQAFAETAGAYEVPKFRGNTSLAWDYAKFGAAFTADYIGDFVDTTLTREVQHQVVLGLQLSYRLPANTKVTLGVDNLANKTPPTTGSSTGYAESTSFFLPRFAYVAVTKKF